MKNGTKGGPQQDRQTDNHNFTWRVISICVHFDKSNFVLYFLLVSLSTNHKTATLQADVKLQHM